MTFFKKLRFHKFFDVSFKYVLVLSVKLHPKAQFFPLKYLITALFDPNYAPRGLSTLEVIVFEDTKFCDFSEFHVDRKILYPQNCSFLASKKAAKFIKFSLKVLIF